ncbi:DUF6445 family protein [Sphingobium sp. CAP-1]|uniref:DUF6445 family protein n=1 Tax=Sphingobium sp. CAP-1 TaxID=2676077 RepID=UPI0012BB447F|nr:DUF6445 family protein [Sphingobium sp. CAP-1]QGP81012.1 hypothetical protein GL174_18315 [Sphingobium sp. CAP-1]
MSALHRLGRERNLVAGVDNILRDPDGVRAAAAAASFTVDSPFYPGVRAALPKDILAEVELGIWSILSRQFGCCREMVVQNASFALTTAPPERLRPPQRIPHFDGVDDSQFAALIHLGHRDLGGTGFFRHRSTGYETITADREADYFTALRADLERHGRPTPAYIDGSTAIYDMIGISPARFNRMAVYRGNMLHSALVCLPDGLNSAPSTGRLTITCFLTAR